MMPGPDDKVKQFPPADAETAVSAAAVSAAISQPQPPPSVILDKSKLHIPGTSQTQDSSIPNHSSTHSSSSSTTSISSVTMLPLTPGSSAAGFGLFVDNDSDDTNTLNSLYAHEKQKESFLTAMTLDVHELQAVLGMDDDEDDDNSSVKKREATMDPTVEKSSSQAKMKRESKAKKKKISSKQRKPSSTSTVATTSSFGAITITPTTRTMEPTTPTTAASSTVTLSRLPPTMLELRQLFQRECPGLSLPPNDLLRQRYNASNKSDRESDEANDETHDLVSPLPSSKQKFHQPQQQQPLRHNPRYGLNKSLQEMLTSDRWTKTQQDDRDPDDASSTLVSIASGAPPPPPQPAASSKWTEDDVPTTTATATTTASENSMRSSNTTSDIALSPYRAAMESAKQKKAQKIAKAIKKKKNGKRSNSTNKKSIVESEMLLHTIPFPAVHEEGKKGTVLLDGYDDASNIEEDGDMDFEKDDGDVVEIVDFTTMRIVAQVDKAADDHRDGYEQDNVVDTVQNKASMLSKRHEPQQTATGPSSPVSPLRRRIRSLVVLKKKVQITTDAKGTSSSSRRPSTVRTVLPPRRSKSDTRLATHGDSEQDESLLSNSGGGGGTHSPTIDRRGKRSVLGKAKKRLLTAIGQVGKKGHNGQNLSWGKVGGGSFSEDDDNLLVGESTTAEAKTTAATTSKAATLAPTVQQLQDLPLQMDDEPNVEDSVVQPDNFMSRHKTREKIRRRSKSLPRGLPLANRAEANGQTSPRKSSKKKRPQARSSRKQPTKDQPEKSPSYQSKRSHDPSLSAPIVHASPITRRSGSNREVSDKKHSSFNSSASSSLVPPQRPTSIPSINSNSKQTGGAVRHKRAAMRAIHARQREHEPETDDNQHVNASNDRSRSDRQASTRHSRLSKTKTAGSAIVDPFENGARSLTNQSNFPSTSGIASEGDDFDVYANQSLEDLWKKAKLNAPKPYSEDETPPTSPSSATIQFDDSLEGSFTIRW